MFDADVIVVGYGPVGAMAALLLGRGGVNCLVLDRRPEVYPQPRAVAADQEIQRMLVCAGLGTAVREMLPARGARLIGAQGRRLLSVELPGDDVGLPGLAFFRQPSLERRMRTAVDEQRSVSVCLGEGSKVVGLAQDEDGVEVRRVDGSTLRAQYVIACDGASSSVRRLLGVRTIGGSFAQQWLVVDAFSETVEGQDHWVSWHCDPARPAVVVPSREGIRVELMLSLGSAPAQQVPLDVAAERVAPYLPSGPVQVERATTYSFQFGRAASWRAGRVLLAGDAAHRMPPFAGQGLAAGIRDVCNLAWRLQLVLAGAASPALLDDYEAERGPHLRQMVRVTRLAGELITTSSPALARARDLALQTVPRVPWLGKQLCEGRIKPPQRLPRGAAPPLVPGSPGGGDLVPSPVLEQGKRLDSLRGTSFALVGIGLDPRKAMRAEVESVWSGLGTRFLQVADAPTLGRPGEVVIVRPDHFVVDTVPSSRLDEATAAYFRRLRTEARLRVSSA